MEKYDYLIVGAGLFGAVFAHEAKRVDKHCLVIDKRNHRGGNIYCEDIEGIHVHKYGAHIFHTDNKEVWDYVNSFVEFNRYTNSPLAYFDGKLYNLPFNMNTFYQLWGVKTPAEAKAKIEEQRKEFDHITTPANLEEQALKPFTIALSKVIQRNNGDVPPKNYRHSSSNVFLSVSFMTTTISMTATKESPKADTTPLSMRYWKEPRFVSTPIISATAMNWTHWQTISCSPDA